jgi:hypothetical protein
METPKYTLKIGASCVEIAARAAMASADAGDRDQWRVEMLNALASITCALREDSEGRELVEVSNG